MSVLESDQLTVKNEQRQSTFQHSVVHKTHINLALGRFPHPIALFALMNKSDATGEYSDADCFVVQFLTGEDSYCC